MQSDDLTRVRHMFEAAENAQRFVSGKNRADLDTDPMLIFALVRAIEIIGEAASKVSTAQRTASPTVTEEIPSLQSQLLQLLQKESAP